MPERSESLGFGSLGDRDFKRLSDYIERELGIRMPDTKRVMLESRLQKRVRLLGLDGFPAYVDYVFSDEGSRHELINMIDAVTTNKTDFFREADHFDFVERTLVPEALAVGGNRALRFWSAGCSTGEEPYTLAMVLEECREDRRELEYAILASDISTAVLQKAITAVYDEERVADIPVSFRKKYLLRSKDRNASRVRIRPELRARVEFIRVNLMDDRYPVEGLFDAVFCRNVIIYFERPTQERILRRLVDHVRPGGYLVLGHSETLTGMDMPLKSVAPTIYRRT
ncbi:MAG: methyltransferase domain-containing protein [Spirochaetales bacterium]|nr:methyltransferase domain-containing protein [Spirochaetales bacterium]